MEPREYTRLAAVEDRMWWFAGLHRNLIAAWRPYRAGSRVMLDAGCGTGGFLARLAAAAPSAFACGLELDAEAAQVAHAKSGCAIAVGNVNNLPYAARALDAIFSADVLCHRGVAEHDALAEFRRCLKTGGVLVLNLPAYRWLHSAHDEAVDNAHRYGRGEVLRLLRGAGFAEARARYWNSIPFPLMVLRRKLPRTGRHTAASEVALLPAPLERLLGACLALERGLGAIGLRFPFGGSILATAVKP